MEFDWSVINRIKYYIGELHFKNELGSEFLSLLNNHKFDEASKMIIKKNVFNDKEIEAIIVRHIMSYTYAC